MTTNVNHTIIINRRNRVFFHWHYVKFPPGCIIKKDITIPPGRFYYDLRGKIIRVSPHEKPANLTALDARVRFYDNHKVAP